MQRRYHVSLGLLLLAAYPAAAHPLTDVRFDRTVPVRLSANGIDIGYTLELSALAMHLDAARRLTPAEIAALDRTEIGYARAYARSVAKELQEKLKVAVDSTPVTLTVTNIDVELTDHVVCRFSLHTAWPLGGRDRRLAIRDETFVGMPGVLRLTLDLKGAAGGLEILDSEEPPARFRSRPLEQFPEAEAPQARLASAEVRLPAAISLPANAAESSMPEPRVNEDHPAPTLAFDLFRRGLPALFDSPLGMGFLLLAAFLFGAAHAFTPGHGKTLVAAYLIGERGTVRHAAVLAGVTTLTHTGSVIAVAAILWGVYGNDVPGRTQGWLQLLGGVLVAGVGGWLLFRRVTGQPDHFHLFGGHHHHHHDKHTHHHGDHTHTHHRGDHHHGEGTHSHDHSHSHDHHSHSHPHNHDHSHTHAHDHHHSAPTKVRTTAGWLRIVLMGMGGGIIPCWDAVLLLVAAVTLNRVGFAIPLLLAFSAGLGAVLVGLGIGVVYAYRAGGHRFKDHRWFRFLPVASAGFLLAVGIWLILEGAGMWGRS